MFLDYPYRFDGRGHTARTDREDHLRDLIEQVLFTAPGERVNRPEFGSGVQQALFAPNSAELAAATQFLVQGSLQHWLGDLIEVEGVDVENDGATLRVTVRYLVRRTQQRTEAHFSREGA
jgi:uncharacterized protein